ncbi:MAG: acyl dehydratase [Roseobacter sp.]
MQHASPDLLCQRDSLDPARATALNVSLGREEPIHAGDPLPPFFHQVYFWDPRVASDLGRDGHPKVGGLIPDMQLPRRMWAGGRLQFHRALVAGQTAQKQSRCVAHERKIGRSGPLGLVTLRHDFYQSSDLCVTEWQNLVYRAEQNAQSNVPVPPIARADETVAHCVDFTSTALFRYSALTYNGHRIHYDLPYAQDVEGYDGLVVHGPLLAQLLILFAEKELGTLSGFSFRATAPLMHFEIAELCCSGTDLWVRGPDGRQCMTAKAELTSS